MSCAHPNGSCPWACDGYIGNRCAFTMGLVPDKKPTSTEETFHIKIGKVFFDGKFSHWEFDAGFEHDSEHVVESTGTAPSWTGVIDMAIETLESHADWLKDDANANGANR